MLHARALSKVIRFKTLFQGIDLSIHAGDRLGIIGPNGAGKSTLLKILAGTTTHDDGEINFDRPIRTAFVTQDDAVPDGVLVRDHVISAAIQGAEERQEPIEDHQSLVIAETVLSRAGFQPAQLEIKASTLSGGWKKRLNVARAIAHAHDEPDLLLLDEPTNHLDLPGLRWLEATVTRLVAKRSAAVAFVTHDRAFLEQACTRIAELSRAYPSGILAADGNYTEFLRRKQEFLEAQASQQQSLANQVRKDLAWLARGPQGRGTKSKGRIDRSHERIATLSTLKDRAAAANQGGSRVEFNSSERRTRKLLVAKEVSYRIGDRVLFEDVSLKLGAGDRLGLLGPNGSGKTTLIRVLTGQAEPHTGEITLADPTPKIAVFSQHRTQFPDDLPLRDALCPVGQHVEFRGNTIHVNGWARRFLFHDQQLEQPVGSLSGGELARVHVARIMLEPCDILVLDEPTNDLDIPTLEILEESLEDFPGALVLVTHDRAMLSRLADTLLALDGRGTAATFASLEQAIAANAADPEPKDRPKPKPQDTQARSRQRRVKLSYHEQREFDTIETDIEAAEQAVSNAEQTVQSPDVLADHEQLTAACSVLEQAQAELARLYERWEYLEQKNAGIDPELA